MDFSLKGLIQQYSSGNYINNNGVILASYPIRLEKIIAGNDKASNLYLQLFNIITLPNAGSQPFLSYRINTLTSIDIIMNPSSPIIFSNGCSAALSTSQNNFTQPAGAPGFWLYADWRLQTYT